MTSVGVWLSISFAPYQIISVGLFLLWAKVSEFSFIHISEIKCFFFKMYFKCSWLLVSVIFNMRFWCRFFFAFTRSRPSDGMTNEIYYDRLLLSPFDSDKCDLCIWLMFHLRFLIIASLLVHGEIKTKCFTYKKQNTFIQSFLDIGQFFPLYADFLLFISIKPSVIWAETENVFPNGRNDSFEMKKKKTIKNSLNAD